MRTFHIALAALALVAVPASTLALRAEEKPAPPKIDDLSWMSGTWRAGDGNGGFEEHWTAPWAGTMAAVSREAGGGQTGMFELSTIESVGGKLVLHLRHFGPKLVPSDMEKDGALTWPLAESKENRVVFTEPSRDFPRSIVYERDGRTLKASLLGATAERNMQFELTLVE